MVLSTVKFKAYNCLLHNHIFSWLNHLYLVMIQGKTEELKQVTALTKYEVTKVLVGAIIVSLVPYFLMYITSLRDCSSSLYWKL